MRSRAPRAWSTFSVEREAVQRTSGTALSAAPSQTAAVVTVIPPARESEVVDPTGCGDAYRAGLILGLMRGLDLPTCGRMASLMGALKVGHPGTQNQKFTYDEFAAAFREQFGDALD
jgi:adenosine kinase